MRQEPSSENCRLVYLTRRAYETGEIRLLLRTDNVCAEKDTGWQLLQGSETGLELSNPGNSLLVSVARALEIEPKLAPFLTADTPPQKAAYAYDEKPPATVPPHTRRTCRRRYDKAGGANAQPVMTWLASALARII